VLETLHRPAAERNAATAHVQRMEYLADAWSGQSPLWLGHGLHQSFLAGVTWARRQIQERCRG
jgi:hypothetical protein